MIYRNILICPCITKYCTPLLIPYVMYPCTRSVNWGRPIHDCTMDLLGQLLYTHYMFILLYSHERVLCLDSISSLCKPTVFFSFRDLLADDDINARRTFSRNVFESVIDLLENEERCTALGNYAITSLEDNSALNSGGIDYYPSPHPYDYLLYLYTGFWTAEDICYALEEAFTSEFIHKLVLFKT